MALRLGRLSDIPPNPDRIPNRHYPADVPKDLTVTVNQGGSRFVALADRTVSAKTLIRGTDDSRVALVLTNNDAAIHARVGDSNVSITQGVRLPAGGSLRFTGKSELWAVAESGSITLSMSEELL